MHSSKMSTLKQRFKRLVANSNNRLKLKSRLSKICKSIKDDLIEFCNTSTMHGLRHIVQPTTHRIEKILWFTMVVVFIYFSWVLELMQINRYYNSPTVVSIKKNFREWTTNFPAVTICLNNNYDMNLCRDYILKTWNVTEEDEKFEYYMDFIQHIMSMSFRSSMRQFWKYDTDTTVNTMDLASLVHSVISPDPHVRTTLHNAKYKMNWTPVLTEMGVCVTYNSIFSKYQSLNTWHEIQLNPNYLHVKSPEPDLMTCNFMTKRCYVKFRIYNSTGKLFIHSPYEIAEHAKNPIELTDDVNEVTALFSTLYMQSDPAVRKLDVDQRGCKYPDEAVIPKIPAYSNGLCLSECRIRLAIAICGCRPYFYIIGTGKPCDVRGMACLGSNMEVLINLPTNLAQCLCVPQCTEINYILQSMRTTQLNSSVDSMSETVTSVKFSLQMPKVIMSKEQIYSLEDLIASFGGTGVLFLGISFISIVEICVFIVQITIRTTVTIIRVCRDRMTGTDPED